MKRSIFALPFSLGASGGRAQASVTPTIRLLSGTGSIEDSVTQIEPGRGARSCSSPTRTSNSWNDPKLTVADGAVVPLTINLKT